MLFSKAALFAIVTTAFTSLVQGQTDDKVKVHVVKVSDKDVALKFFPESLEVPQGEAVQFQFFPLKHSVAQSSFEKPCEPLPGSAGFFSGFMPVSNDDKFQPTFTIVVNQTEPIWFYCATGEHCQAGMVGVINP